MCITFFLIHTYTHIDQLGPATLNQTLIPAVIRSGALVTLQLDPLTSEGAPYMGPLKMLVSANDLPLGSLSQVRSEGDATYLNVHPVRESPTVREPVTMMIDVYNNISNISFTQNVTLAGALSMYSILWWGGWRM